VQTAEALVKQVVEAPDLTHVVAVLWTWLEERMPQYGSLKASGVTIRTAARRRLPFAGLDEHELERLRRDPYQGAAELLSRVARALQPVGGAASAERAVGFDGADVIVIWKHPDFSLKVGAAHDPPSAAEHPSLEALAPRLTVQKRKVAGLALAVEQPGGDEWTAARLALLAGMGEFPTLSVHLDPLEHHGLTGWTQIDGDPPVGWFDEHAIDADDQEAAVMAVEAATEHTAAMKRPAILVLPELAATPTIRVALETAIGNSSAPPALTVVGLYHGDAPDDAIDRTSFGEADVAGHVNDAVVLGPRGGVLWQHRKLSKAYGIAKNGADPPVEDIVLSDTVTIVSTPVGIVAVAICLDSFQKQARERYMTSGADVVLVPSLSPKAFRHRDSLQQLVQATGGCAFICNRGFHAPKRTVQEIWNHEENRSFWTLQRRPIALPAPWRPVAHPSFVFTID
jgi:hypothetical protein